MVIIFLLWDKLNVLCFSFDTLVFVDSTAQGHSRSVEKGSGKEAFDIDGRWSIWRSESQKRPFRVGTDTMWNIACISTWKYRWVAFSDWSHARVFPSGLRVLSSLKLRTTSYSIIQSFLWNTFLRLLCEWSHIRDLSTDSNVNRTSTFCCIINSTSWKYPSVALPWKVTYRGFHTQT